MEYFFETDRGLACRYASFVIVNQDIQHVDSRGNIR